MINSTYEGFTGQMNEPIVKHGIFNRYEDNSRYVAVLDEVNGIIIHKVKIKCESDDKNYLRLDKLYDLEILIDDEVKTIGRIPESKIKTNANGLYMTKDVYNKGKAITYRIPEDITIKNIDELIVENNEKENEESCGESVYKEMQETSNEHLVVKGIVIPTKIFNIMLSYGDVKLNSFFTMYFEDGEEVQFIHKYKDILTVVSTSKEIDKILQKQPVRTSFGNIKTLRKLELMSMANDIYVISDGLCGSLTATLRVAYSD